MRVTDSTPEADEPTSFGQKTKDWYERNKPKILAVGGAVGAMAVTVAVIVGRNAVEQSAAEETGCAEDSGGAEDSASAADSGEESEQRNSPGKHNVAPHKRRLKDGREIDVSGYERGGSSEDDEDPIEDEGEDPGEDAA